MAKFEITWLGDEKEIVNKHDCDTVEQYISSRFGDTFNPEKATVALVEEKEESKPEVKATAKTS
jgi:hypothetical protein